MFQKLAPIFILIMFAAGTYLMVKGMDKATQMGKHKDRVKAVKSEIK